MRCPLIAPYPHSLCIPTPTFYLGDLPSILNATQPYF